MLTSLRIENFAIVAKLELDLTQGMTAFTGETGAGKSIMIDALMLALGERSDASVIRLGTEKCEIQACFTYDPVSQPAAWLMEHDIPHQDGELYLRRTINLDGRSKSYINGYPFPLQKVKELSAMLVDIHGQHQHQTLLHHATHRQQLDQYADHTELLSEVKRLYQQCQKEQEAIDALKQTTPAKDSLDLLHYHLEELTALHIDADDINSLNEEHQLLHHAREYLELTEKITNLLDGDESFNLRKGLNQAIQSLSSLPETNAHITAAAELLNNALIQCDEALNEIAAFSSHISLDPHRLNDIESRLSDLHRVARKHHTDIQCLPALVLELQQKLGGLKAYDHDLLQLQQQHEHSLQAYHQAALTLRQSRQRMAKTLAEEITTNIRQLGMPKGHIAVEITPLDRMQPHGLDKVEYTVCTNPGTALDNLSKIVSGGELSRISLAIHMITAHRGLTPTLVFDEVDVGIGGATAAIVGGLLRRLGQRLQVFCVTHQPQVAACAHTHYRVEKCSLDEATFSSMVLLDTNNRIEEIARMLGGLTITDQTRAHAKELLQEHNHAEHTAV